MDILRRSGRRSAVIAAVLFVGVTGGVAWAAGGQPSAAQVGASLVEVECQTSTITTDWAFGYDSTIPGYAVTGVVLDGLDAGCLDKGIRIVLADSSGVQRAEGVGLTPSAGTSMLVVLSPGFDLNEAWISQMSIVIHS